MMSKGNGVCTKQQLLCPRVTKLASAVRVSCVPNYQEAVFQYTGDGCQAPCGEGFFEPVCCNCDMALCFPSNNLCKSSSI